MDTIIHEVAAECFAELDKLGIEYGYILSIAVDNKSKQRLGLCKNTEEGFKITISNKLLNEDRKLLKETMMHEILHTCRGCLNHGDEWKRLATRVNNYYGYNIKRAVNRNELSSSSTNEYAHKIVCTKCGQEIFRARECKITRHPELWRCAICDGELKKVY